MNDSMSVLLAATLLGLGGLGLYMYKSSDQEDDYDYDDDYNEDSIFSSNFWGLNKGDEVDEDLDNEEVDDEEFEVKPRKRASKTHKNRKSTGSSRRRY